MSVGKDRSRAYVTLTKMLFRPNSWYTHIRLKGLEPSAEYRDKFTGRTYMGDMLMNRGLLVSFPHGDFATLSFLLERNH